MTTNLTPSVSDIATALEEAIQTIDGLRTVPYLGDTISPPVAMVAIDKITFHGAFAGGNVEHTFVIHLILARGSDRASFLALEAYMSQSGPTSIRAAIEADPTLGGVISTSICTTAGPPAAITIGGAATYMWCPFEVTCHA